MARSPQSDDAVPSTDSPRNERGSDLDRDEVFHILQNERRRNVIRYLDEYDVGDGVDMGAMTDWIAAREHGVDETGLESDERQRVYIALYQSHLPKLDEAGIVDYDRRRGWLSATARTRPLARYLARSVDDDPTDHERNWKPWTWLVAATVAGAVFVLGSLQLLPIAGWSLAVVLFGLLAATMLVDRLGETEYRDG